MKKNISPILIGAILIFHSCSKDNKISNNSDNLAATKQELNTNARQMASAPTRKAKQYTITDLETGQTKTMYDCREAGGSCDVGENPPPAPKPPSGNSKIYNFQSSRNALIEKSRAKSSEEIWSLLNSQKESRSIFPNFFDTDIQMQFANRSIKFTSGDNYIAIVKNNTANIPVFVYMKPSTTDNQKIAPNNDSTKTKVAKINTETGVLECRDPGGNCATSFRSSSNFTQSRYMELIGASFGNKNLPESIFGGSYGIYETKKVIQIKPLKGKGEIYYILK